jgi:SAM-dependent MidA family methyltransferase
MKASAPHKARPEVLEALKRRAGAAGVLTFEAFMDVALYDPVVGYYRSARTRVGFDPRADFVTASSSAVFGRALACAAAALVGPDARHHHFIELGSETPGGVLEGVDHPFASVSTRRIGEPLTLSGRCVVFSNELFDAQPFRRFRFRSGAWRELGVALSDEGLCEVEVAGDLPGFLPSDATEGYTIDAPVRAGALAAQLAREDWTGLFLAFDYGRSWTELATGYPEGTARAYRSHSQKTELLADAGDQDLTCHVCWDWIQEALAAGGFARPTLVSQEAFLVTHAAPVLAAVAQAEAGRLSRDKLSLLQLLHPGNMGQKFQALWALRA